MGVEPNWKIYRTTITRAQKPLKIASIKEALDPFSQPKNVAD